MGLNYYHSIKHIDGNLGEFEYVFCLSKICGDQQQPRQQQRETMLIKKLLYLTKW